MMLTKEAFDKMGGRIAYHWSINLPIGYGTPEQMTGILEDFTSEYLQSKYEVAYAVHTDKDYLHGHIIFNSVSCIDGKKFHYKKDEWERKIVPLVNRLCMERGLPILDLDGERGEKTKIITYKEWLEHMKGHSSWKDMVREDVDFAIGTSKDYATFIVNLENMGYEVTINGKHIKVRVPGMGKDLRLYKLDTNGEYTEQRIRERLKYETPKRKQQPTYKTVQKFYVKKERLPRKKKELSYFQRQYLRYMYMFGNIKRQPNRHITLLQRKEAARIAKQMNYVFFSNMKNKADLATRQAEIETKLLDIGVKQKAIYTERKRYRTAFEHLKGMHLSLSAYEKYSAGQDAFALEAQEYEKHRSWLEKNGYKTEEQIKDLDAHRLHLVGALLPLRENKQELQKELRTINEILREDTASLSKAWQQETERDNDVQSKVAVKERGLE